jgi:putative hydrolase of HD superfamily
MSFKEKLIELRDSFLSNFSDEDSLDVMSVYRDGTYSNEINEDDVCDKKIYRLRYINYHNIGLRYGMNNKGLIDWAGKPFFLPNEMTSEEAFKVLSYLTDFIEKEPDIEECSLKSVNTLNGILIELDRFGFISPIAPVNEKNVIDLFTVSGFNRFKKSEEYNKYFEWYTPNTTKEEVEKIYLKCGLEFKDIVWINKQEEKTVLEEKVCVTKEENVLRFYVLCNKLKNVIRTGWTDWRVNRDRIESVAEHVYSVQMLALAMKSEYKYDIDIEKVIKMLAVHELEEILIGDLTLFQITKEEKDKLGHEAVKTVLKDLIDKEEIINLITEFDERKTKEARFAFYCDKLECDLQCKLYDEEGCVDLNKQEGNKTFENEHVQRLLTEEKTWSGMWLQFGQDRYSYDENFTSVSNYAKENNIKQLINK